MKHARRGASPCDPLGTDARPKAGTADDAPSVGEPPRSIWSGTAFVNERERGPAGRRSEDRDGGGAPGRTPEPLDVPIHRADPRYLTVTEMYEEVLAVNAVLPLYIAWK